MSPARPRRLRGLLACAVGAVLLPLPYAGATPPAADSPSSAVTEATIEVPVGAEPDGTAVTLDATVYTPGVAGRHPAVVLAHGLGGSKDDLVTQARDLASHGLVVLAYSARGFGASGGRIHLDDPDYEVADARTLVDTLAERSDVLLDTPGDPRVAIAGGSYGGALALMASASDPRVDATVALITWNDLADSLFPQAAVTNGTPTTPAAVDPAFGPGPFKQLWASRFFVSGLAGAQGNRSAAATPTVTPSPSASPSASGAPVTAPAKAPANPLCGRYDPEVCRLLLAAAETGEPTPELVALLRRHSPARTLGKLAAPTLLVQGMTDSLFGLDQADATARALAARGTPFAVRWTDGGHDGPSTNADADTAATRTWLTHYLTAPAGADAGVLPIPAFSYALPLARRADQARIATLPAYPGLDGSTTTWSSLTLRGPRDDRTLLTPPGGAPASVTTIPGLGALGASLPTYQLAALPGQSTAFTSFAAAGTTTVVGAPRLHLKVTSLAPKVTLFVSLWKVVGDTASQPRPLVAALTAEVTPGRPSELVVALPAGTYAVEAGSIWRVLVSTTDSAYAGPRTARIDRVALADLQLEIPTAEGALVPLTDGRDTESLAVLAAIVALLLVVIGSAIWRRRVRTHRPMRPDLADTPLVIEGLVKTFKDGHRAVDDVSWRAERGQVVGLLGPNGAGKTTTMRMLLGLIRPDAGEVHVLGEPVTPGAPVLSRVGALVEGPGFLPHLTGRDNLKAYWQATGRPQDEAGFEEALDVAALGGALDRPVRTYSHGMKQRLGIAQAMLGKPEVLFLDEPTNGLDPPQIAAMRPILQDYAATGRTVVVSSHLLAEVEMTCSHVVVMHAGRVVTAGPVADLIASEDTTVLELATAPGAGADTLGRAPGIRSVEVHDEQDRHTVTVVADLPRAEVVAAAVEVGLEVTGVGSRRHLEEVFLGVIAAAQSPGGAAPSSGSLVERLRQVRAR